MPFVGFTQAEITADEKGPQLPTPVINSSVVAPSEATGNRPAIQITTLFPVPEDSEVQVNKSKTRSTYGLGSAVELTLKDAEGNRLLFTGRLYAQSKAEETIAAANETVPGEENE